MAAIDEHRRTLVSLLKRTIYSEDTHRSQLLSACEERKSRKTAINFFERPQLMANCISKFSNQVKEMLGFAPGLFWRICWTYISPLVLLMIFTGAVIQHKDLEWQGYQYPNWSVAVGWCLTFSSLLCVPIYGIYCFLKTKGTLTEVPQAFSVCTVNPM
ncbi:hypothetical protein B4U80_08101 [Leptotrombidium deliense]|uniref:Uncharacterized protein n=1 Tax=Leptotrombidium deliense TaxID=299467 RepID=A0A443SKP8_9ACAR|nr:hypothetical protein B4U80_08101 [Leptotrombidium deliense]